MSLCRCTEGNRQRVELHRAERLRCALVANLRNGKKRDGRLDTSSHSMAIFNSGRRTQGVCEAPGCRARNLAQSGSFLVVPQKPRRSRSISDDELITVASRLWPRVQAHARRELANKNSDESVALAAEVWEGVLQSVSKTLQRRNGKGVGDTWIWKPICSEPFIIASIGH